MMAGAGLAGAIWYRASRIRRALANQVDQLSAAALATASQPIDWSSIDTLPMPVAGYLRRAIGENNFHIRVARLRQRGRRRTDGRSRRWLLFDAAQVVVPPVRSFVWNASVSVVGPFSVRVIDALADGKGSGRVLLQSALQVAESAGGPEMDSGALHRYLAESVWYPTALLPSPQLRWDPVDERRAIATLSTDQATVNLEFWFNDQAEVIGIYSPGRWGTFGGRFERVPWEGHFSDYIRVGRLRVPSKGEVGWYLGGPWCAVWKGTLLQAAYDR